MLMNPFQVRLIESWTESVHNAVNTMQQLTSIANTAARGAGVPQLLLTPTMGFVPTPTAATGARAKRRRQQTRPAAEDRVALVTGGNGGIGSSICQRLAEDGHTVIAAYYPAEEEQAVAWRKEMAKQGFDLDVVACDVTDFDSCRAMVDTVESRFGRIDVLVNCAGITRDTTLKKMDESHWHSVIDTNLDSVFNVTRNVVDGMVKRGYGRIINISSVNGQKGQFGQTNYSAAKAGMLGFTRSLARELAREGVTVNTVSPGYVATSMVMAVPEEIREQIISKVPVGRLAKPAEIASAVSFLASEENAYVTGADLAVNGGLFMY